MCDPVCRLRCPRPDIAVGCKIKLWLFDFDIDILIRSWEMQNSNCIFYCTCQTDHFSWSDRSSTGRKSYQNRWINDLIHHFEPYFFDTFSEIKDVGHKLPAILNWFRCLKSWNVRQTECCQKLWNIPHEKMKNSHEVHEKFPRKLGCLCITTGCRE